MKKVTVIGAGAWGTAIAKVLAENGAAVTLWVYEKDLAQAIQKERENGSYLHGVLLPDSIRVVSDLQEAMCDAEIIFEAIPVPHVRMVLNSLKPHFKKFQRFVVLSKGIEQTTCFLPSEIIQDVLGKDVDVAVVSGPSFARELAHMQMTGVVAASSDQALLHEVKDLLENRYLKLFFSHDMRAVQVCGALKNVVTLGVGMLEGAGYKDNTKAFFMVQMVHEMQEVLAVFKCKDIHATLQGLAGMGDLVLTAFGRSSKNLSFGQLLGKGLSVEQAKEMVHCVPEGIATLSTIVELLEQKNKHLPLFIKLHKIIHQQISVATLLDVLVCD